MKSFEKYLTLWVALCIVAGITIGKFLPAIPEALGKFEYANVSIPVAILIWLMIYPMMLNPTFTLKTIFHKFILVLHSPLIFNSLRNRHSSF